MFPHISPHTLKSDFEFCRHAAAFRRPTDASHEHQKRKSTSNPLTPDTVSASTKRAKKGFLSSDGSPQGDFLSYAGGRFRVAHMFFRNFGVFRSEDSRLGSFCSATELVERTVRIQECHEDNRQRIRPFRR
jgi:hypothetical protein